SAGSWPRSSCRSRPSRSPAAPTRSSGRSSPSGSSACPASDRRTMPYLDRAGISIYYEVTAGPDGKPPLLLSHGYGASAAMWAPNLAALAADRPVITWDMRGHGRSGSPDDPEQYSHAACVADMAALLDAAGAERAVL